MIAPWTDFGFPVAWLLLAALPLVLIVRVRRHKSAALHASVDRLTPGTTTLRVRTRWLPIACRLGCLALLIAAIARPQERSGETRTSTDGIAMQVVLDRSSSMQQPIAAGNTVVSRFDAVKEVLRDFVLGDGEQFDGRPSDMIGLITFAAYAETACPLVRHHEPLVALADAAKLATPRTADDGTAIGDALALALARLKKAEDDLAAADDGENGETPEFTINSKAIVLLTDGQNNRGDVSPVDAARLARDWGVTIYAIDIGEQRRRGFGAFFGNEGSQTLRQLAEITGGMYWNASDTEAIREVYEQIDALETTRIESVEYANIEERFPPFAIAALTLLVLEVLLSTFVYRSVA